MATFTTEIEVLLTGNAGSKISALSGKLGTFSNRVGRATAALTKMGSRLESAGNKMSFLGARLTVGLTAPIAALGIGSLRAAARLEALQRGLTAVMGSSQKAAVEFDKLREVARLPGLGLKEAATGSLALQSAGFSADSARRALLAFGNAAALAGRGKDAVAGAILAVTQLVQKSSGFGQDLRQLVERLPQVRGALKAAFGTASTDEITGFGVSGADVVAALIESFEKLPPLTTGLFNAFENLGDSIEIALGDPETGLGAEIDRLFGITERLDQFGAFVEKLSVAFSELSPGVKKFIIISAGLVAVVGPALIIFGGLVASIGALFALLAPLGAALIPIALGLAAMTGGMVGFGAIVATNFKVFKEGFLDVWQRAKTIALPILKEIKANLRGIFDEIQKAFREVFGPGDDVFARFGDAFKDSVLVGFKSFLEILNLVAKAVRIITPFLAKMVALASKLILKIATIKAEGFEQLFSAIGATSNFVGGLLGDEEETAGRVSTGARSNQLFNSVNNNNNNVSIFLQQSEDKKISVRSVKGDGNTSVQMSTGSMLPQGA